MLAASVAAAAVAVSGPMVSASPATEPRVIGGQPAVGFPGVVALAIDDGTRWNLCTAALVRPRVLLTAAHCLTKEGSTDAVRRVRVFWPGTRAVVYSNTGPRRPAKVRVLKWWSGTTDGPRTSLVQKNDVATILLGADLGVAPSQELLDRLRTRTAAAAERDPATMRSLLREELITLVDPTLDRTLRTSRHPDGSPAIVLIVGVNGTGKTTTTGKLARVVVGDGGTVLLGAADTFRAAASAQLQTWGDRVGAVVVQGPEGGDPASVAFDAVRAGREQGVDTVVIDTAGRLHTKTGLMDELGKVKRVIEKQAPVDEVLLVLDATTGQNGLTQARVFAEVVDVTGIVLTKLDGTAKGGIVVAVQRELGVPVKLVGLGEGPDDLAPFEPEAFVDALLAD